MSINDENDHATLIRMFEAGGEPFSLFIFTQTDDRTEIMDESFETRMVFTADCQVKLPDGKLIGRIERIPQVVDRYEESGYVTLTFIPEAGFVLVQTYSLKCKEPEPYFDIEISIFREYQAAIALKDKA